MGREVWHDTSPAELCSVHLCRASGVVPAMGNPGSGVPGGLDEAIQEYRAAVRLEPAFADAHLNLGIALFVSAIVCAATLAALAIQQLARRRASRC